MANIDPSIEAILDRLVEIRRKRGISTIKAGELLFTTHSNISHIERGRTKLTMDHIMAFARIYQVSPHWIIFGEDDA